MEGIKTRRIKALYDYKGASSSNQEELLELLLAMISHKQVKDVIEDLNIKVEGE